MAQRFYAGHNSNDFSEWTTEDTSGSKRFGIQSVAALGGSAYGLRVVLDSSETHTKVTHNVSSTASRGTHRLAIRINKQTFSMTTSGIHHIIRLTNNGATEDIWLALQFYESSGSIKARAYVVDDNSTEIFVSDSGTFPSGDVTLEVRLKFAANATANDGELELYVNGSSVASRSDVDIYNNESGGFGVRAHLIVDGGGSSGYYYVDEIYYRDDDTQIYPPAAAFTGYRALVLDIDKEAGETIYTTVWDYGALNLLNNDLSDLSNNFETSFGSGTASELDNRTYWIAPYTPAFPGVADFGRYVYVYGRWNDGSVNHLALSTDAGTGTSFGSNLGDGTWGSGWVGAFMADDEDTLYAFVNGASRALWRSTNGGSSWSSLSSLPFDVDPGGASKHADGRIMIINRSAAAQMVAVADGPNYSSWTDVTDAFPTGGGGARSLFWVA